MNRRSPAPPATVYVDFDDVLCETASVLSKLLLTHFGKHVPVDRIFSFDLDKSFGLTPPELQKLMDLMHEPDVLLAVPAASGAREVLLDWKAKGVRIEIVTGRPPHSEAASRAWLQQQRVPHDELVFVDKYNRIDRDASPLPVLSLEDLTSRHFDLAIDDAPSMIQHLMRGMAGAVVIMDRPWNRELTGLDPVKLGPRHYRCEDWEAIGRLCKSNPTLLFAMS